MVEHYRKTAFVEAKIWLIVSTPLVRVGFDIAVMILGAKLDQSRILRFINGAKDAEGDIIANIENVTRIWEDGGPKVKHITKTVDCISESFYYCSIWTLSGFIAPPPRIPHPVLGHRCGTFLN